MVKYVHGYVGVLVDLKHIVIILSMFFMMHSMEKILQRYERYTYADKAHPLKEPETQEELHNEYRELKRRFDALQRSRSHLMGENIDTLTLTELQQLELQLETTLKHIRSQMFVYEYGLGSSVA
uniref:MADS-box protein 27 n=1 Tax=Erycina pusilla TaxID=154679 RepID=X2F460_9ASPA|nr:MADS-box protein 27 [Erycina pusilla]AJB29205.1 MADS27 [Erycina pusilla]